MIAPIRDIFNIEYLKIFDKHGYDINWNTNPIPNIELQIQSETGKNASLIPLTDVSGNLINTLSINKGYMYEGQNRFFINYPANPNMNVELLDKRNCLIHYIDTIIYNPEEHYSRGIDSIEFNVRGKTYEYPSYVNACSVFLEPVSCGLIETESLYVFQQLPDKSMIRPLDANEGSLVFMFYTNDDEETIRFFNVDETSQNITWSSMLEYELNIPQPNEPLSLNIGFKSDKEGVFESTIKVYYKDINGNLYLLGDIVVNAEAIAQEDRFKTLCNNFGLYDIDQIHEMFKESDIHEALPDYKLTNEKSKLLLLEYQNIMPYIGSYKALINAVKWLGYDDIYFREWFKNIDVSDKAYNTLITYKVPYNAKDRKDTILQFTSNDRIRKLKKLNVLSMVYCLNKDTGDVDEWGNPETVNCYSYNINEILIKLYALKEWLEKNIIGVNAKIIDIMGEGVYFERFENNIYSTQNIGYNIDNIISMTVDSVGIENELINGESFMDLTLRELRNTPLDTLNYTFADCIKYAWNPKDGIIPDIQKAILNPKNLLVGPTFNFPIKDIQDIKYRVNVENPTCVLSEYTDSPLFIYDNTLSYYNQTDKTCTFNLNNVKTSLILEKGHLISTKNDDWEILYEIGYNADKDSYYIKDVKTSEIKYYNSPINILLNESNCKLFYNRIDLFNNAPLLILEYYKSKFSPYNILNDKYYLDIIDGTISLSDFKIDKTDYINFEYDLKHYEQLITVNTEYESKRLTLYNYDPSTYWFKGAEDPKVLNIDNSVYRMWINHIGKYDIEAFGWDGYNNIYYDNSYDRFKVWTNTPTIQNFYEYPTGKFIYKQLCNANDTTPIFPIQYPMEGLVVKKDSNGKLYINLPSTSYAVNTIDNNTIINLYNLTESATVRNVALKQIALDQDYVSFNVGDLVSVHLYDTNYYQITKTFNATINKIDIDGPYKILTLSNYELGNRALLANEIIYVKNITSYPVTFKNISHDISVISIPGCSFKENQVIALDICKDNNVLWTSSYRIKSINTTDNTITLDGIFPVNFMYGYNIKARYAYYNAVNYQFKVKNSEEKDNEYNIYLDDKYYMTQFLDNTFSILPYEFDHVYVKNQWQDASVSAKSFFNDSSTNLIVDTSTRIILKSVYNTGYMLKQRNIWSIYENSNKDLIAKVYNDNVPFMFNIPGVYNIICETYDGYGNMVKVTKEGFITVTN